MATYLRSGGLPGSLDVFRAVAPLALATAYQIEGGVAEGDDKCVGPACSAFPNQRRIPKKSGFWGCDVIATPKMEIAV